MAGELVGAHGTLVSKEPFLLEISGGYFFPLEKPALKPSDNISWPKLAFYKRTELDFFFW